MTFVWVEPIIDLAAQPVGDKLHDTTCPTDSSVYFPGLLGLFRKQLSQSQSCTCLRQQYSTSTCAAQRGDSFVSTFKMESKQTLCPSRFVFLDARLHSFAVRLYSNYIYLTHTPLQRVLCFRSQVVQLCLLLSLCCLCSICSTELDLHNNACKQLNDYSKKENNKIHSSCMCPLK